METPFPEGVACSEYAGVCMTTLDTFAAGCLGAVARNGRLDAKRLEVLKACERQLAEALPSLPEHARQYFEALADLVSKALVIVGSPHS